MARRLFDLSPERLELLRARRRAEGVAAAEDAIPRRPEGEAPPPSFAQERLWFLDRLAAGAARLAIPAALLLDGPLDARALAGALADVVARHEPLRSRFRDEAGRPRVEVLPPERAAEALRSAGAGSPEVRQARQPSMPCVDARLPHADHTALPEARHRAEAERLVATLERFPFDLAAGPLLVALLARLADQRHALVLAVHHVAADGWSLGVLFRDLAAGYALRARGATPPRREPAVRYGDWAAWQRRRLEGERGAAEAAWWRERLAGAPRLLDLPADRPRSPAGDFRGASLRAALPPPLADRLRALGRAAPAGEATPFMVLLALLAALLCRWSGETDLVVGTPVAGRTRRETEGLVGLFLNHLALRLDLAGDPSMLALLDRARRTALDAYAHQELPFERLLEALAVPRDLSATPMFQVFLNLLSFPPPPAGAPGLAVAPLAPPRPPARFDLTLYADDRGAGGAVTLDLVYDARRFDRPRMEEALRQLAALAEQAVADPRRPLSALSLLTAAARRALPDPRRRQDAGWPGSVHAAVERHAAAAPGRPAVLGADGAAVSYGRLAAAVRGLAARLAAAGVRRGDVVAVHACREPALAAAVLAIHRAGAAFLLLDPAHPAPRNALCVRRAAPAALLRLAGAPPWPAEVEAAAPAAARLDLPPLAEAGAGFEDSAGEPEPIGPDDLAYVAFTSGSTGEPKGVLGLHRSLTHFLPWQAEAFSLGPDDRVSLLSGLAHDPLHRDLFTPLWVGGAVAVPDPERFAAPGYLAGWMARTGVTVLHGTPSLLRLVAEAPAGADGEAALPALRWAFLVGEALRGADLARLAALAPRAIAVNLYGSTESQRAVAWCRAEAAGTDAAGVVPLGRGMPDVDLLVLGRGGLPCGVGEVGEVYLRSPHLAAGYLGRPADTAAVFVPDPFGRKGEQIGEGAETGGNGRIAEGEGGEGGSRRPPASAPETAGRPGGGRLYRTGDLGRFRPDGLVEPLGRRDRQVKVLGVRIEPAEIEAALAAHPAVAEAAVVALGEGPETRLAAYWTRRGGPAAPPAALWRHEAGRKPASGAAAPPRASASQPSPEADAPPGLLAPAEGSAAAPHRRLRSELPAASSGDRGDEPAGGPASEAAPPPASPPLADLFAAPSGDRGDELVAAAQSTILAADLRAHLAARLPAAMVPAELVCLEALPRTPNGKLDRAALPPPEALRGDAPAGEPPATPAEERLAAIWREVLDRDTVGRHDDFFALGGHSLALTRVLARVREAFGAELPVRRAFEASTLAAQAAAVENAVAAAARELSPGGPPAGARAPAAAAVPAPPLVRPPRRGDRVPDAPLAYAQRRLWFLDRLQPGSSAYTLSAAVELAGALRPAALAAALTAVVRRQAALRTRFPLVDGLPVQRVDPAPARLPLPLLDLSALPPAAALREAERRAAADARRRFDLARGPLLAASLLRLAPARWRLLFAVHHAVADGWSLGLLAAETSALYSAAVTGVPARLPALPVRYADWAAWQRAWLDGDEALAGPLAWWRRRLDGLPAALELPTDRPRGAGGDLRGGRVERRLPAGVDAALADLGRRTGTTRFMLLLAALGVVLARWSGQRDLAVGSPEAGRTRRETEHLVGLFLDLLVLRLDLSGEPTFEALLGRVRETVLDAFAHREVPFERLLEALAPERDPARPPLVEVLLNVFAPPRRRLGFADLDARLVPPAEREARFPLTLYAGAGGEDGAPVLALVYRRALFDRARAEELLDQLVLVLAAAAADPARPVAALPALTARARAVLADPAAPLPAPSVVPVEERFAAVAVERSGRPAVVRGERSWSYGELATAADGVAAALRAAGVEPGETVAVGGAPSFGLVAAALAVLRMRAVLLLLDPALPAERRRRMAETAGARLLVTAGEAADHGAACPDLVRVAVGEDDGRPVGGVPRLAGEPPRRHPPAAAYVVFTSGTTGEPKGVLGSRLGLAHFLAWQRTSFGVGPGDRVAQLTALSFDVVLRDLLLPLTSGAALVLPDDAGLRLDPERVLPWLERHRVSVLHAVPALAREWLAAGSPSRPRPPLAALRWVLFAGEPLPAALVETWRTAFPGSPSSGVGHDCGIVNLYGPTETTLARCAWRVPEPPAPGVQPVGRALPDSQALVLAGARRCGPGEVGEIVLRTPCRSLGYLGARAFFPSPFRDDPEDLLYATGDLGRFRLDGTLEILGRRDRQVKLRGVRVEPAEVEAALAAHPSVAAAAVAVHPPHLVAWVVPAPGAALEPRRLRAWLARRLPAPLVPSRFVPLDRLPTGAHGKLDRDALPPPPAAPEGPRRAPRDEVEAALVEIFRDVLRVEEVGAGEGFFELGGHSLLAVPLLSRIERRFRRRLPLAALFERPTVEELAELLRAAGGGRRAASPLVTLQAGGARPPLFLVHPGGGGVLCYADLARTLGPEQPFHALQSVGLDGGEPPLRDVGAMAERYLAAMAEVRRPGPVHLGGWSFGGRVAFEMAQRLRAAGEEVGLVALLDVTPVPSPGPARRGDAGGAPPADDDPDLLARALADAFPLVADDLRGLDDRAQLAALLEAARAAGRLPAGVELGRAEALFGVFKANMAAARAFRPRPYAGPVLLVRAAGSDRFALPPGDPRDPDPSGGWAALAAEVELAVVPGDHHSMVRPPHVEHLAAVLRAALDQATGCGARSRASREA